MTNAQLIRLWLIAPLNDRNRSSSLNCHNILASDYLWTYHTIMAKIDRKSRTLWVSSEKWSPTSTKLRNLLLAEAKLSGLTIHLLPEPEFVILTKAPSQSSLDNPYMV